MKTAILTKSKKPLVVTDIDLPNKLVFYLTKETKIFIIACINWEDLLLDLE